MGIQILCKKTVLNGFILLATVLSFTSAHKELNGCPDGPSDYLTPGTGANLPVFFFHGMTGDKSSGNLLKSKIETSTRKFIALDFCTAECSFTEMNNQVQLAITQIRSIITGNKEFDDGYIFMGHSLGGFLAFAVMEQMEDHKVRTLITMASPMTGLFFGPQPIDAPTVKNFVNRLGPAIMPGYDFAKYSESDYNGKVQREVIEATNSNSTWQQYSGVQILYSPAHEPWASKNMFLPVINNINTCKSLECMAEKERRKRNFLRVGAAHYFGSPADGLLAPWQSTILGQYSDVKNTKEIETKYSKLKVVDMKNTVQYREDTYGLKTMDKTKRLFLHAPEGVIHDCWAFDLGEDSSCKFDEVFAKHIAPIL